MNSRRGVVFEVEKARGMLSTDGVDGVVCHYHPWAFSGSIVYALI